MTGARSWPAGLEPNVTRPMNAVSGPMVHGGDWAYEFKWDGARALAWIDSSGLQLRSRSGADVTARYPELHGLVEAVGRRAVLDGEIVVLDGDGVPSFAALQSRLHLDPRGAVRAAELRPVVLVLFDLLALDDVSLLERPYVERRAQLRGLGLSHARWQVPPAGSDRDTVLGIAADRGLEGVVAKRAASRYRPGRRSSDWVKLKLQVRQEMVVGGWRPGRGGASGRIGALLVGVHDETGLRYAGGVGSGLTEDEARRLGERLVPTTSNPFVDPVPHRDAVFVEPREVVEVRATGWTPAGRLRHPVYLGLALDRDPSQVRRDPMP